MSEKNIQNLVDLIQVKSGTEPIVAALILGSGLADIVGKLKDAVSVSYADLDGFPNAGVSGHGSDLVIGTWNKCRIAVLTGRAHYYENGDARAMRVPLATMKALGAQTLLVTNSAGSLTENVSPGNLMMMVDHINYAGMNPLIGEPSDSRFVNMVDAYDPVLRSRAKEIAVELDIPLVEGVYFWYSGPSFETPAEIKMAQIMGAQSVGMSTAPEVILARFMGMRVWGCSMITNFGAGMKAGEEISHAQTKRVAKIGAQKLEQLLERLVGQL